MQPPDILEGDRVIRTEMRKTGQTDFLLKSPHGCDMLTANKSNVGWHNQKMGLRKPVTLRGHPCDKLALVNCQQVINLRDINKIKENQ